MKKGKKFAVISSTESNFNRHKSHCSICAHPEREEIEREFISWKSPAKIVDEYELPNRSAVYRHAHAVDLFSKRYRNLLAALGRIIERVDEVEVTAGAVVQAINLLGRLNARGELVELDEQVCSNDLFDQMNPDEREAYAKDGTLPSWFPRLKDIKDRQGSGGDENA